ncbi:MAG: ATP-binding cassette domain-containing protein [Ruminococcaceae bacterium]|nr:ATP-binding cassette domain-containing protein [Oscillospiraceae bacterium]
MIKIEGLNKTYHLKSGNVEAVKDVNLSIEEGEIYGIIGYSGAGKSSLIRCINLLEVPDSGSITVGDQKLTWTEGGTMKVIKSSALNKARRGIGMIFQHFNLLDRSTVFDNIAYPLKHSGLTKSEIAQRVKELLELVDLTDKIDVYPSQLSGGQKQRVAIARALANNPKVLLSDEATSALDPDATESILALLKRLNKKLGITIVLITHEMAVIKAICHKVAVMENGYVVEEGEVYDIFANPQKEITKKFIGSASALNKINSLIHKDSPLVRIKDGELLLKLVFEKNAVGDAVISQISRNYNVNLNIVLASVEVLKGAQLGSMITVISGDDKNIKDALDYLRSCNIKVEVLRHD